MTGFSKTVAQPNQTFGWSCRMRVAVALIIFASFATLQVSKVSADDTSAITETSLVSPEPSQVSDRESRLRDIEDELLKQLSMGATPSAQESTPTPLANIKHIATSAALQPEPTPPAPPQRTETPERTTQPQRVAPSRRAPAPARTAAPSITNRPRVVAAALPEPSTIDVESIPDSRRPEPATVVPVTAKPVPHRTPKFKRSAPSEELSAKDLEHRLAIAESQLTLLTKELETTKAKLAQSESNAQELSRQIETGASGQNTETVQGTSADIQQTSALGADDTDAIDTRAESYATVARVTKDNAPLRIGPSARESTIFRVSRNSTVKIEHRTGEWYRVITTDGTRGWIAGSALIFDEGKRPGSTVQVKAFETRYETMNLKY